MCRARRCAINARLFDRSASFGIGHFELQRKRLIDSDTVEQQAHCIGGRQPHGRQRLGRLCLELIVQSDMEHRAVCVHANLLCLK